MARITAADCLRPTLILKVVEFIIAIVCFALESHYSLADGIRPYVYAYTHDSEGQIVLGIRLIYVTSTAFPLIFMPIYFICACLHGNNILNSYWGALMSLPACVLYIACGSYTINKYTSSYPPADAFGALCIIDGGFFLADFLTEVYTRWAYKINN